MSVSRKLAVWSAVSAVILLAIFFGAEAVTKAVSVSDQTSGNVGAGVLVIIASVLLVGAFLVAASLFVKYLVLVLESRRGLHH